MMNDHKWVWEKDDDGSHDCGTLVVDDLRGWCELMTEVHVLWRQHMWETTESWHCAVYRDGVEDPLFSSHHPLGAILDRTMAQAICEAIIAGYRTMPPERLSGREN